MSSFKRANCIGFILLVFSALQGCANIDAVKEFGKISAEVSSYPEAGKAFQESAVTALPYRIVDLTAADKPEIRKTQVDKAALLHATLSSYFSTLAKLAGEDAFSLDKELDAIGKGLQGLPGSTTDTEISSAVGLTKILSKYVLLRAQEKAVADLVDEGGKPAMMILESLEKVSANWSSIMANDRAVVVNAIGALEKAKDVTPLLGMLARERRQQLDASYKNMLDRMRAVQAALERIRIAHEVMEQNRHNLTAAEVKAALKTAVADLKLIKTQLIALR